METFGDRLRKAREARGVRREAIAAATHIRLPYLEALERSDLDALPGAVFDRGYIRSTAQFLGIDPQPILDAYAEAARRQGRGTPESERQKLQELSRLLDWRLAERRRNRLVFRRVGGRVAASLVVLGALIGLGWLLHHDKMPIDDASREEQGAGAPSRPEGPMGSETLPPRAAVSSGQSLIASSEAPQVSSTEQPPLARPLRATASAELLVEPSPEAVAGEETIVRERKSGRSASANESQSRLRVPECGVGTAVKALELVGAAEEFEEGTPLVFWTRVIGGRKGDVLYHRWLYQGRTVMYAPLRIGGPHWRTYSRYTPPAGASGTWRVEARTDEGVLVAHKEFVCLPDREINPPQGS